MKRRSATLLSACLLASACLQSAPPPSTPQPTADDADPNGGIVTAISADPDTIDPQLASFPGEIAQVAMAFESLLSFEPSTLRPIPAAARDLPEISDDGLTVTFTLRDGLTYSDGAALRARDFVYGWQRLCDPNVSGAYQFVAYVIRGCEAWSSMDPKRATADQLTAARDAVGVRADGDRQVVFRLVAPAPYFLSIAALWVGSPTRQSDATGRSGARPGWVTPATYAGNGPFRLTEWTHGARLVFERNDRARVPARLKRWTKVIVTDPATAQAAFQRGELDVTTASRDETPAATAPGGCSHYYGFNTRIPPFDDASVRLAFAKALDRDSYVRDAVTVAAAPALSLIPRGIPGSDASDDTQAFDPVAARSLLASSRYGDAMPRITFRYLARATTTPRVDWAIAQWRANLGVTVIQDPVDPGWWGPLVKSSELQPALLVLGWCTDYPDPKAWLPELFRSGSTAQRTGYASSAFDALVARADVEADPAKRLDLYRAAQRVLTRDAPVAFMASTEARYLVNPRLHGYSLTAFDSDFGQFTLANLYLSRPFAHP